MSRWTPPADMLALTATSAATTWMALTEWHTLVTYPSHFLVPAALLGAVLAVTGAALDAHLSRRTLFAVLLVIATLAFVWVAGGTLNPLHARSPYAAVRDSITTFQIYRTPIYPTVASVTPLLFLGSAVALLAVQWLAAHLRHGLVAGLGLLAVVAVSGDAPPSLLAFVGTATGFLALLLISSRRTPGAAVAALRSAAPIGAAAIGAAVLAAAVLPVPHSQLLPFIGDGGGPVTIRKPVVDLRGELLLHSHEPLLDVTTDDPDPSYLRIAVLNRFTGVEWSSGDRNLSTNRKADGDVPLSPGLSPDVPRHEFHWDVQALPSFFSTWLPTAYPISSIAAAGDWRWDPATMDFIAGGDTNTAGQRWTMTSERLDLGTDGRFFRTAKPGTFPAEDLVVPSSVPTSVRDLALRLTSDAHSDYERALVLQSFFHDGGRFRYSLTRAPADPVGTALTSFLQRRVGYCQQFAGTMALMARIVGIPARVAVGFLTPHPIGDNTWRYTSDDLHAWPELYFEGTGWVRFEPTPAVRSGTAPAYSLVPVQVPQQQKPDSGPTQQPTGPTPGTHPTRQPQQTPRHPEPVDPAAARRRGAGTSRVTEIVTATAGTLVLLVAATVVSAMAVRRRRRSRRLAGGPESVWAELRATATDLGLPWPSDRSPRETAGALLPHLGAEDVAAAALAEVVGTVEEVRYASAARTGGSATRTAVGSSAAVVIGALNEHAEPRQRRLARWMPRSLVRR